MPAADPAIALGLPAALWNFLREACQLPAHSLQWVPGQQLPEPARRLLVHDRDMTSTLAGFHGSPLRVDILQHARQEELYLREVFLRTQTGGQIVEYGVTAIVWDQFTPPQQEAIARGQQPLGGLLHRFEIPFTSAPIRFFSVAATLLTRLPFRTTAAAQCQGRFNLLARPGGEPLAWIMEILPPAPRPPSSPSPHA